MLGFDSSGEAVEPAVRADDAMTRNDDRDRIAAVCGSDGAERSRSVENGSLLGVGSCLSVRDGDEFAPGRYLEGGAFEVERDIEHCPI